MSRAPNIIVWRDGSMRMLASHSTDATMHIVDEDLSMPRRWTTERTAAGEQGRVSRRNDTGPERHSLGDFVARHAANGS